MYLIYMELIYESQKRNTQIENRELEKKVINKIYQIRK